MCYIMIGKKLKPEVSNSNTELLKRVILKQMKNNSDGFFISSPTDNINIRTLDSKEAEEAVGTMSLDNTLVHLRLTSSGLKTTENVHGWEIGDWQFMHNGTISTYVFYGKNQQYCDSNLFFKDFIYNINHYNAKSDKQVARTLKDLLATCQFWGRAMLYNKVTDKAFMFGDWHTYLIADEYLAFSSCSLNLGDKSENKIKVHGLNFETQRPLEIGEEKFDGLSIISNFSKPNWHIRLFEEDFDKFNAKPTRTVFTECQQLLDKLEAEKNPKPAILLPEKNKVKPWGNGYEDDDEELMNKYGYSHQAEGQMDDTIIDDLGLQRDVVVSEIGVHDIGGECCKMVPRECYRLWEIYYMEAGMSLSALEEQRDEEAKRKADEEEQLAACDFSPKRIGYQETLEEI